VHGGAHAGSSSGHDPRTSEQQAGGVAHQRSLAEEETVKLDPVHWFMRLCHTIKKSHGLQKVFMQALRDAVFAVNAACREEWNKHMGEKLRKSKQNYTDEQIEALVAEKYNKMLTQVPRAIPAPDVLHSDIHRVYQTYGYALDHKTKQVCFLLSVYILLDHMLSQTNSRSITSCNIWSHTKCSCACECLYVCMCIRCCFLKRVGMLWKLEMFT